MLTSCDDKQIKLCLVTSSGGHLFQLYRLQSWWRRYERFWVVTPTDEARWLLKGERVHWAYYPVTRNYQNLVRNTWLAWQVLSQEKPDLLISTGSGVAIPFFYLGKLFKAETIFIEVYDRIDMPTWTGKLVYPISNYFFLQRDEQKKMYPRGEVLGSLL